MKTFRNLLKMLMVSALILAAFAGCESTDTGSTGNSNVYFGVGFGVYDPWYYGDYWDDPDIIVTPPDRPETPVKPTHPIVTPSPAPQPRPMPSIPSTPRPMPMRRR